MAPVTVPIMIAIPVPISRLLRQDTLLTVVEILRTQRGGAIGPDLPGVGRHSVPKDRARRIMRG